MDRKIIFLDIDGTLIAAMSEPSALATAAVRGARKMGHKVFLCTGRNMAIIGDDILKIGFDGVISSAGGHVEVGEEILFDSLLPEETVQECLDVFHDHGVYCRIETREGIYMDLQMEALLKSAKPDKRNSELIRMQKEIEKGIGILPYEEYPGKGAYKICFTSTTLEALERTKPYLEGRFAYAVHMYGNSSSCFNGEIIPKGIDKCKGMELVCRYLGADRKDTIAFGDSMNDYGMMKYAHVSVAMGNACDDLKETADIVCECVEEDGVYYELKRMGVLNRR